MTQKSSMPAATPGLPPQVTKLDVLRLLLKLDAVVLFSLGLLLIIAPRQIQSVFQFKDLPPAVSYLIGMWGCVFATMAFGYWIASMNPLRHIVWIQVGIVRGALECIVGLVYMGRGVVTWKQGIIGLVAAACITISYICLYPKDTR